jgi:hypothetical protein
MVAKRRFQFLIPIILLTRPDYKGALYIGRKVAFCISQNGKKMKKVRNNPGGAGSALAALGPFIRNVFIPPRQLPL